MDINLKIGIKEKINKEINRIFQTENKEYTTIEDIDGLLRIGYIRILDEKDLLAYLLSRYGLNSIRSAIEDILFQHVFIFHKEKGFIDYGEYSINGYLNPYLNDDQIWFINMDILSDYL